MRYKGGKRPRLGWPVTFAGIMVVALTTAVYHVRFQPVDEPEVAEVPRSVSLRLNGPFDPSYAGEMVAARAGLFDREGLHIELKVDNPEIDPLHSVSVGIDNFGTATADSFVVGRSQGERLTAFAGAYLESPVAFYVREKSGIRTPNDFVGKRIGYQPGQDTAMIYQALMARVALSRSEMHEVRVSSDVTQFLSDAVDVWPGHVGAEAYDLKQKGVGYNILTPAEFGVHVPGTVYFTTEKTAREHPELVRRFLRAVIAGWQLTYSDEVKSIPLIVSYAPTVLVPEFVRFRLDQQRELLRPFGARFGEFEETHWQSLQNILLQQKRIKEPIDLSSAVTFDILRDSYRRSETRAQ
jgi:ABC-type nitrate/sulfonate/bicarbonate transport system substrate-binding protein